MLQRVLNKPYYLQAKVMIVQRNKLLQNKWQPPINRQRSRQHKIRLRSNRPQGRIGLNTTNQPNLKSKNH